MKRLVLILNDGINGKIVCPVNREKLKDALSDNGTDMGIDFDVEFGDNLSVNSYEFVEMTDDELGDVPEFE